MSNLKFISNKSLDDHYKKHVEEQHQDFYILENHPSSYKITKEEYIKLANKNFEFCDYFYPANYAQNRGMGQLKFYNTVNSLSITTQDLDKFYSFFLTNDSKIKDFWAYNFLLYKKEIYFIKDDQYKKLLNIKNLNSKNIDNFWIDFAQNIYQLSSLTCPKNIPGDVNYTILYMYYKDVHKNAISYDDPQQKKYAHTTIIYSNLLKLYYSNNYKITSSFKKDLNDLIYICNQRISANEANLNKLTELLDIYDPLYTIFEYVFHYCINEICNLYLNREYTTKTIDLDSLPSICKDYEEYIVGLEQLFKFF